MKKRIAIITALALAVVATTAIVVAVGDGGRNAEPPADSQVEKPAGEQGPIRSNEGIDADECNLVHNISVCTEEELEQGFRNTP